MVGTAHPTIPSLWSSLKDEFAAEYDCRSKRFELIWFVCHIDVCKSRLDRKSAIIFYRTSAVEYMLCLMNALVAEYCSLPPSSDHLPDMGPNDRKCNIIFELDERANDPDVSELLLQILRDPREFDLARVEAIKVAGIYVSNGNPLAEQLWAELDRIAASGDDEMLQGWAQRYVDLRRNKHKA